MVLGARPRSRSAGHSRHFIDFVAERLQRYPGAHIYHYAHYEPTALKRLMTLHGTREAQLDDLLRGEKFVDLYKVVREGIRTSESGPVDQGPRGVLHAAARGRGDATPARSIVHYERWRVTQDAARLESIRAYNEDDCRSTHLLRDWLLGLRPQGLPWFEVEPLTRTTTKERDKVRARPRARGGAGAYRARLLDGLSDDEAARSPDQHDCACSCSSSSTSIAARPSPSGGRCSRGGT